jgi:hypothetical protein
LPAETGTEGATDVPIAHKPHHDIGLCWVRHHGDVEVGQVGADVGDDGGDLRATIGLGGALDRDPHRTLEFADAIGATGDLQFRPEGGLEEAVKNLGVGEAQPLLGAQSGDIGILRARGGYAKHRHQNGGGHRPGGSRQSDVLDSATVAMHRIPCEGVL